MKPLRTKAWEVAKAIERNFPGVLVIITHDFRLIPPSTIIMGRIPNIVKFDVRIEDKDWNASTAKQIAESFSDRFTAILRRYPNALARRRFGRRPIGRR